MAEWFLLTLVVSSVFQSEWTCFIYLIRMPCGHVVFTKLLKIELWKTLSIGSSAINKSLSFPEVVRPDD